MIPQDSFFKRLQPLDKYAQLFAKSERFGTWNPNTLGIMLVRICCTWSCFLVSLSEFSVRYRCLVSLSEFTVRNGFFSSTHTLKLS